MRDDRLRLIFTCCHPSLATGVRVALTLRLLGGLTTEEIARAFLVPEPTMAQRLVRAKNKIRDAGIPYRVPYEADLPARLRGVLAVVYLIFNEGHLVDRPELTRGGRPARSAAGGADAGRAGGAGPAGVDVAEPSPAARPAPRRTATLVLLADQDRAPWDRTLIDEGQALVRRCLRRDQPGPYQIQAAINAVHSDAPSTAETDWAQVVALYDQLMAVHPDPGGGAEPRGGRRGAVRSGGRARRWSTRSTWTATTCTTRCAATCSPPRPRTRGDRRLREGPHPGQQRDRTRRAAPTPRQLEQTCLPDRLGEQRLGQLSPLWHR